jgi:gluconolactonase
MDRPRQLVMFKTECVISGVKTMSARLFRQRGTHCMGILLAMAASMPLEAEDWGAYAIVPVSAPGMVLDVADAKIAAGAVVSIGTPAGKASQKWVIESKGNKFYSIKLAHDSSLVLAAAKGGIEHGTTIVLETANDEPWQEWQIQKQETGIYSLTPRHAPKMGLDHFGGKASPGAKIDLWTHNPGDQHLHWMIRPLAGTTSAVGGVGADAASTYLAPEIKPEEILKGKITTCSFSESTIFPGTVREVTVFIPAQYDGSKPACVYVKTDGYSPQEKALLERLIATREMPVTIGVFVRPGELPPTMKNTLGRRNRCFEYDGVGDNHVRFLVEELLPFVAGKFDLKLSPSGNDRCIAGGSSGGIAAFNAAWERPDSFSRVYANSGSFVAFRGGHEFPTLVRKFEAKPIRAYLTTGTRDMENCAGDWFLLDQEMDKALRFSGYDYAFRVINGGHVAGYYEHFPEAMSFIWKDWPQPVVAGVSAPRAQEVIVPGEAWQLVSEEHQQSTGPTCNASGEVYFVNTTTNTINRIDLDGHVHEFVADAGQANSLTIDADGRIISVSGKTGKILRYEPSGQGKLVAEGIAGRHVLATPAGGLYVTSNESQSGDPGSVWFVKDGQKKQVDTGLKLATGLAYRPDQWLLSVADGHSKWAWSYQMNPDGILVNKERFFWLHVPDREDDAGAESICYAKEGQMLVATRWGIQVCADDGPTQVILPLPDRCRVLGVCLGGREFDTLFAFSANKIWKRKVKLHGIGAFTPWTAVSASRL